jgi:hypothetical protein
LFSSGPNKKKERKSLHKKSIKHDSFCVYDDETLYLFFFFFLDEKRKKEGKISERIIFLVQFKFFVFFFSFLVKEFIDFPPTSTVFALGGVL